MECKRNDTNELTYKNRKRLTHRLRKGIHGCWRSGREVIVQDFGKVMNTLINFKWITTKTYCVAHGTQFSDIRQPGWAGSPGENGSMYMYG